MNSPLIDSSANAKEKGFKKQAKNINKLNPNIVRPIQDEENTECEEPLLNN